MGAFLFRMRTMSSPKDVQKQSHGCPCQGCKFSGTFRKLHPEPTPAHTGTLRNLHQHTPEPFRNLPETASGTYTSAHRNPPEPSGTCLRNLHQHTAEPSGTFGTCLRNLHHRTLKPSGTFRNLPPEPTPAHTGTLRNLPEPAPEPTPAHPGTLRNLLEPSSGTCSCDPHLHTPELIWAEDPISLRCWGKKNDGLKEVGAIRW